MRRFSDIRLLRSLSSYKLILAQISLSSDSLLNSRNTGKNFFAELIPAHSRAFMLGTSSPLEGVIMRRRAGGTGCGCLRVGLVSQLPGGFGPRPTGTTARARGARSVLRGNPRRQARPGAEKCRVNKPRRRKLVWVERREASALIARRANAFARCSGGSIARSAKGASQAPSAFRRSIPSF